MRFLKDHYDWLLAVILLIVGVIVWVIERKNENKRQIGVSIFAFSIFCLMFVGFIRVITNYGRDVQNQRDMRTQYENRRNQYTNYMKTNIDYTGSKQSRDHLVQTSKALASKTKTPKQLSESLQLFREYGDVQGLKALQPDIQSWNKRGRRNQLTTALLNSNLELFQRTRKQLQQKSKQPSNWRFRMRSFLPGASV